MIALDLTEAPIAPDKGEDLYDVIQGRVQRALLGAALAIIALLLLWTWGDWPVFFAAIAFHVATTLCNIQIDRHAPRFGRHAETVRVLFNHTVGAAFHTLIGWPLPVWFWLPYTAIAFHGKCGAVAGRLMVSICVIQGTVAICAGVSPMIPLAFSAFSIGSWYLVHTRGMTVASIVAAVELQRDQLATAHTELGVMHEQLTEEIAARTYAENQLIQAQKLEAIGRLAAGVAHEINTPMQFIGNHLEFIAESTSELLALAERIATTEQANDADLAYLHEQLPTAVGEAIDGVKRVAAIVRSMKHVAHPGSDEPSAVDINTTILNALTLTTHEYKLVADVETDLAQLPPILASSNELNQVLINIIVNAAHAIADVKTTTGKRGKIKVESRMVGRTIQISIADTGGGIPETIRQHVFEPFFTSKPVGQGTGQGLALARAVIERAGGELTFETEMGAGTTFFVRLPLERRASSARLRVA